MEASKPKDTKPFRPFIEAQPLLSGLASGTAGGSPVYLVGGAVRDLLIGAPITDFDLVAESGVAELALHLAPDALIHERFGTAELEVDGIRVDIATSRSETYAHPGALPEVEPAPIETDMARRDFTFNAMAIDLREPDVLIDPHGGREDLDRSLVRVLHPASFTDDPTRALRAARYAARFGFDLEPGTAELLAGVDLHTVSSERVDHELALASAEVTGIEALRLISAWGLISFAPERLDLAAEAVRLLETDTWVGRTTRSQAVIQTVFRDTPELPAEQPDSPYEAVLLAHGFRPAELLVNRALGVEWLDRYENEWATVRPSITGDDLVLAGLPQGPAIGVGLAAALRARLDRGVSGVEDELAIAVAAAEESIRESGGPV